MVKVTVDFEIPGEDLQIALGPVSAALINATQPKYYGDPSALKGKIVKAEVVPDPEPAKA